MNPNNEVKYAPIGIFDSGVGGLTVAREILRQLPNERIVYFGDTARVPYGTKSKETIIHFSQQISHFLQTKGVKAIVIACNTASAYALDELQKSVDIPVLGVVKPGAKVAAQTTVNNKIGVIGTEGTISSQIYTENILKHNPNALVIGKACPLFVSLAEEGWLKDPITVQVAQRYLAPLMEEEVDTLVMGCTHYPLLRSTLRSVLGEKVNLVNPAYETARTLNEILIGHGIKNDGHGIAYDHEYFVSDAAEKFMRFANSIQPFDVHKVQVVAIEEY